MNADKGSIFHQARRTTLRQLYKARHRVEDAGLLPVSNDYSRFICLTHARTGSTMLIKALQRHKHILAYSEIARDRHRYPSNVHRFENSEDLFESAPATFFDERVFRDYPAVTMAVGFKIFYFHAPMDTEWGRSVWDYLMGQNNLKVLHLKRHNMLKTWLSQKLAESTNEWWTYSRNSARKKIRIEYHEALEFFTRLQRWEAEFDSMFRDHPTLEIVYEQLSREMDREFRRIQDFLEVPYQPIKPTTSKRPHRPLSVQIENYAELKEQFQGSPWGDFFTD
ncbi:MAG: sulfotransferase [Chloroflexota bacterium]|jgi:hypothetical protein